MSNNIKILIIGDAQHGKDTVADMLQEDFAYNAESSSMAALRIFLFDVLNTEYNKNYSTLSEAYEDRVSDEMRTIWYNEIVAYNTPNKSRLAKQILETNDIYIGMRNIDEFNESKHLFDIILGVYNPRVPKEQVSSNTINVFENSDILLINNGTLENLREKLNYLAL